LADERPSRRPAPFSRALLIAVMVTVLYGAILVAVYGFISLLADQDVITEPDAGPLIGPIMAVVVLTIMFFSVLGGLRPTPGRPRLRVPVGRAVGTATSAYLLGPMIGSIVYAFGHNQLLTAVLFFAHYLASPFVIASAIVALVLILLLPLIDMAGSAAR
jgi:hypothetical protein